MNDAQSPVDALDIAAAATGQARRAAAVPHWAPPVGGLLLGGALTLLYTPLLDARIGIPAAIALGCVLLALMTWLSRRWKTIGVVPRQRYQQPAQRWKQILLFAIVVLLPGFVGAAVKEQTGSYWWVFIPFGIIVCGWGWFALARLQPATWRS
ncbi:hypothetical protein [Nocardia nova]|uniref:hypothetical protein n=1 Tax=Nocardia nova TaxID=37330 RepID=UPI00340C8A77